MGIDREFDLHLTRRQLFGLSARGIGIGALASVLGSDGLAASGQAREAKTGGLVGLPHHAPRAKRVIFLHQSGGPSRSEEHTSELQSQSNLVCRLLLEKKKKQKKKKKYNKKKH